jgi:LPXTG-site transpeptidase (sortase) family protein
MRFRSVLALVLAVAMVLPMASVHAAFVDLDGSPYESAILALAGEGIVSGYPDGTTRPYGRMNRAEGLKVVVNAKTNLQSELADTRANMPAIALFSDIDQRAWYAPYVEVAFAHGMVTGYPDNLFRPHSWLRTEEAIALALKSQGIQGSSTYRTSPTINNVPGQWFTPYINAAIERNLLDESSRMQVGGAVTRGQFFTLMYRLRTPQPVVLSVASSSQPHVVVQQPASQVVTPQPVVQQPVYQPVQQPTAVQQPVYQPVVQQPVQQQVQQQQYVPQVQAAQPQQQVRRATHTGVVDGTAAARFASSQKFAVSIPSLGIQDLTVTHPDDPTSQKGVLAPLQTGVGHLFAYPGQGSKIMIYGHSSGYPWDLSKFTKIFRTINKLAVGDKVYVTYDKHLYVYQVISKRAVSNKDTSAFEPDNNGEELILYTCWPPDSISQRYLVHAVPIDMVALR